MARSILTCHLAAAPHPWVVITLNLRRDSLKLWRAIPTFFHPHWPPGPVVPLFWRGFNTVNTVNTVPTTYAGAGGAGQKGIGAQVIPAESRNARALAQPSRRAAATGPGLARFGASPYTEVGPSPQRGMEPEALGISR